MRLNKLNIIGIIMILFAVILALTNFLDKIILEVTYPFLEGSSQGKSIILFTVLGSLFILYPLFDLNGIIGKRISSINNLFKYDDKKYLKFTIITIFFTYIFGLLIEVLIRIKLGVPILTTFIAYNSNSYSSSAVAHSHVFKSVLGFIIQSLGIHINTGVNAGVPLIPYTIPLALIVLVTWPLIYFGGMIAISNQERDLYKVILAFVLTLSLIGILDGGLFSTPAIIGLAGLLGLYYIKKPFSPRNLLKPSVIIIFLIILRFSLGLLGTNTEVHEITIINPADNIDLQGYNVLSVQKEQNKTIVTVPGNTNDKVLLTELTKTLKGKCSGFFLSWNILSYV
ncbi:MAG: hypothetical protein WCF28_10960 [Methanobacterium sp.]|uniref:hypothetical protein n=1 Tax=Methanobacterium sp. TaxID=2164 RepID=UPI003C73380F